MSAESPLEQAKGLLDDANIDESSRVEFLSALQSILVSDSGDASLQVPAGTAATWSAALKLVSTYLSSQPFPTADEQIQELIKRTRSSPPLSFQERVNRSPIRQSPTKSEEPRDRLAVGLTFSQDFILFESSQSGDGAKPELIPVQMTESDYELLQSRKKQAEDGEPTEVDGREIGDSDEQGTSSDFKVIGIIPLDDDE
jgi:hypothetical protein